MKKVLILGYGFTCYLIFFVVFVYLAAFIGDLGVPKSINRGVPTAGIADVMLNAMFLILFAVPHTIRARPRFKAWFTRQTGLIFRGLPCHHHPFMERSLYRIVRHPLMFGFLLALWSAPTMTTGRLLLASLLTPHIVLGARVEERDLLRMLGQSCADYRRRTPMLLPLPRGKSP